MGRSATGCGLLAGLLALAIVATIAGAIVEERSAYAHGEFHSIIAWNLDAYERLLGEHEGLRQRDPAAYATLRVEFMRAHSPVVEYYDWWLERRFGPPPRAVAVETFPTARELAAMREPRSLDAYLDHLLPHHPPLPLPSHRQPN